MAFSLPGWVKAHKGAAAAVGAGGGVGAWVLWRRSQGGGSPPASGASGVMTTPAVPAVYSGQTDPSYGQLEAQIIALQKQIEALTRARSKKHHKPPRQHPVRKPPRRRPPRRRRHHARPFAAAAPRRVPARVSAVRKAR